MSHLSLPPTAITRDHLDLHLRHWPERPDVPFQGVALLVHGLGEHSGRYEHVAHFFQERGWAVAAYDQRGHGQSPGQRGGLTQGDDLLHDLAAVIDTLRHSAPQARLLVLGHSLGGLLVSRFVAALAEPLEVAPWRRPVDLCVLSSPALDLGLSGLQKGLLDTLGRLAPDVGVGNGLQPEWVCNDPAVVRAYVADPLVHHRITGRTTRFMLDAGEVVQARAATWSVPTLLVYAGSDRCVNPDGSVRFGARAPAAQVRTVAFPGMAHEVLHEPDQAQVFHALDDWLNAH